MTATARLDGRVVVITGANRGVGRGLALAFGAAGAHVVATARNVEGGHAIVGEIRDRGGEATFFRCDVTVRADVDAAIAAAVSHYGGVDVMVHNAVSVHSSEPHELTTSPVELWDEHTSVSVRGVYRCAVATHPHLRDRRGSFLVLTSPAGINGSAKLPFYAGVKGAQRGFVKSLAREWGPDGIRVNGLAPLAATPALERAFAADPTMEARLSAIVPLRRYGDPEHDIGPAAVFLCSDDARYVSGQTLVVSGGRLTSL
jgi:3-oxoacyl-[acyl-carrier protein] reductase